MAEKIRIINDKTREVKYVTPHIAANKKMLASYGFRVEDLKEKDKEKSNEVGKMEGIVVPTGPKINLVATPSDESWHYRNIDGSVNNEHVQSVDELKNFEAEEPKPHKRGRQPKTTQIN